MAAQTLDSDHEKWLIMDDRTDGDDLDNILSEQRRELMAAKTLDSDPEKRPIMDDWTDGDDLDNIRSEQRRELMAAQTLDSDLEMAFKLQMQEAMTASLALVPSSSSHNSPPPSPPHECSNDAALDIAAALMLEDVERFAQELQDHERTVLEMMKAKEDLSRRIHDQKFAVELRDVPEDYWAQHGRYYERPYCTDGASSSKPAVVVETENLRLYCKGLVSEEMVRDVKSVVAGVGVAVCDPMDNLIFEARKNLEAVVDGVVLSNEAAELEAIIEGLNNALDLDLEAVTFFCDDYMIYQYVTNRVQPGNSKVATLVNQVALLQKKFEYCSPSLVARSDIKFALKIAREAIVSQITWQAETSEGKSLKETCVICFEEIDVAEMFTIDGCLHRYCFSCMKQHVEVKFLHGMVAGCPHEGCKTEEDIDSCAKFLAPKLVEAISQRIKESAIPVTDKVYCPHPRCSALMSNNEVLEYTKTSFVGAEKSGARRCKKCLYYFCINCKVPWHFNMNCYDYKLLNPNPRPEDQLLNSLAKKKHWRQCIKCSNMVELAEGCYHITCRCGYEFCYTCGAEWKNKKATCKCKIWDEHNIIREQPQ
ncbi:hypothetical protein C1H46_023358 [Malus baccata]|uniref:RBR-type E3 ubiquitin transferase n=1 Tax=Malus baccata TaxID=106549 RepID=A0A540LX61_MALBA|nr:hypothetical protein C1H46_023358 [Malus baccata]